MPYKFQTQKIKLPAGKDRRVKLSEEDKQQIRTLHLAGIGIREIARRYQDQCSRRLIQFVLFPERLKTVNYPGHWEKYYDTAKHTIAMRKHRQYKAKILNHESNNKT